jgi:hypothetical protein
MFTGAMQVRSLILRRYRSGVHPYTLRMDTRGEEKVITIIFKRLISCWYSLCSKKCPPTYFFFEIILKNYSNIKMEVTDNSKTSFTCATAHKSTT